MARVFGIEEYAAAREDAVHFRNHARHPAHVVILAARAAAACQKPVYILADGGFPVAAVGHIDSKFGGVRGNPHFRLRQHECAAVVERETEYAVPECQYQQRLRAVERVSRSELAVARLEERFGFQAAFGLGKQ